MTANPPSSSASRPFAGLVWLVLALVWVALVRVPLILNARTHLDSDLAVDGLTLLDAVNGDWRWHYPATPFIGTPPVLLSYIQARVWGTTPITLVSGGLVAWGLIVVATFVMNRRAFGPSVASWGLVPLAFASTGAVWLSGRITGGHLLTVAWHAGAFAWLWSCLTRGGWKRALGLGFWAGFGLYIDSMFAVTWLGLVVASLVAWSGIRAGVGRVVVGLLAFAVGAGLGVTPRLIGQRVDPHDAYGSQFSPVFNDPKILTRNAVLLTLECLPRLVAGHCIRLHPRALPTIESDPDPSSLPGMPKGTGEQPKAEPWLALGVWVVSLGCFLRALLALLLGPTRPSQSEPPKSATTFQPPSPPPSSLIGLDWASRGIRWGLIVSSLAVVGAFLVSPNITHSDNYRYLVYLLVPISTGFGFWLAKLASKGRSGILLAWLLTLIFAVLMTADLARWYARFGWLDDSFRPVVKVVRDPALDWLETHREVSLILGDYWDVHRLAFLNGGRVLPVAFPEYPDRFPKNRRAIEPGHRRVLIVRPGLGTRYEALALVLGAAELSRAEGLSIVDCPERLLRP